MIKGMVFLGSIIMLINIVLYIRFERYVVKAWGWSKERRGLYLPIILLILFLAGYLSVGIYGNPDIIMASILLGGSFFVFAMLMFLQTVAGRVLQAEELRVDLQAAERANEAKTVFLSNMSHDIRTPLNAILGYTRLASDDELPAEKRKSYLHNIDVSGRQLLDIINDVLEMSRIESGKLELTEEPNDIEASVEDIRKVFGDQMAAKKIDFTIDTEGLVDRYAVFDRVHLNRVFINLLSNAYKFTPSGGKVEMIITQPGRDAAADADTAHYRIVVRDTGIGMTPEFAKRVFNSFERERSSTVSGIQGTGLGMAITKNIVELMGGKISVNSVKGEGTEFTIDLDLHKAAERDVYKQQSEEDFCECGGDHRVLLAEDVAMNRELAVMMLESMGLCVETACDGKEAYEKVRDSEPGYFDAVLMDIQMPVMDGFEATAMIRNLDSEHASIPIIAVTANAFAEDKKKALDAGMNGHISKPLEISEIRNVLRSLIGPGEH